MHQIVGHARGMKPISMIYVAWNNQYTIAIENRDEVVAKLQEAKIGSDIYYPVPFHKQECCPIASPLRP